ncbi:MAG: tetratricopeptide repeat protein, partial [Acidobacteria bacterium]|nr:tetratricopeptide repeat protein [Acidobacteriota bacterium]
CTVAGTFAVGLEGPAEINAGQQTTLKAVVTLAGTRGTSSAVPADIARQFAYAWSSGPANLGKSSSATRSYRLDTPGTHTFTVKVTRHAMEAGRAVERTIGEKSWSIKVNKPGTPAATTAGAKPSAAGGTGAAAAARGAGAGASSAGGAAAAGAPAGSAAAPPSAASIPEVAFDPAFTAGTWSLQSATDETSPVDTGTKPCPDALRTEKNFYDDAKTKLRTEYTYYLDSGRTIRCGAEKRYYENGILQYEATRLHDAFEGRLTRYWGSGRTFDVTTFEDGTKSGLYVSYWSNGQLRSRGLFRMNRKYDAWSYFLQDGTLEAEGPYYRKFSTVVSNDVGCPIESNDPHHLNEGLYWQCGNRFGAWTFVRKGEKVTEIAQKRGDVDDQVDRDYWDRMAGSATLKGLEAEFTSVNGRLNAAEGEVAARPSCTDCRQTVRTLTMQLEKIGERMGVERDRLYAESRAKFVKAGSDVEAPEPPKAAPTAGTVTLSSTGAATSLASATSSATWSEFPKSVAWGDKPAIRVAASGGGPALFTAIGVTGFSGDAVRASGAQAASWNGLANALFAQGVSKGATRTIQVKHRGPGGLATRSYVYEWTEAGAISATLTVPGAINGRIVLGQSSAVRAAVATASQKPAAAYVYQWQPNPEVTFGAVETSAPQSSAVFTRLGPVKLWVTILQATGGRLATVGESNQADVEVVPPSVKLGVSAEPRPGREVRVTTTMTPEVTDRYVDFWWEVKGNVLQAGAAGNARSFSFRPKDTMPVTVTVHGKVRDGGDEFAKEDVVITPLAYDVRVSAPRAMGPTPQEWRPGVGGLGDVQRPIVVFQNVSMRADIAPAPGNASLRYAWTVSSDACSISNPVLQEPTFSCSQPGTFDVAVVVRDDLGCVLGSGTGRLPIARSVNDPVPPSTRPPATGTPAATPARPPVASDKPTPTTAKPPTAPPATMPPATTPATTPPATPPATTPPAAPPATKPPAAPPATKPPAAPPATKPPAAPTTAPPTTAPTMAAGSAALVTEAQGLYDAGKYADAAKAFDAVIAADPSSAAAFAGRGLSRYGLGDRAGALADFEQALRVDPNHADAYRGRSMVRRAANDFTGALADAQRAVALAPNQYRAYLTRGLAKQKVTDNGGALFDFTKAIELKPDYAPSYAYRASVRLEVMDYDGALADYNRYLGMNPNDSSATNNRGVVKDRLGDIKGALADFERAAALDPANTNATRNIGLARAKLKGGGGAPSEA